MTFFVNPSTIAVAAAKRAPAVNSVNDEPAKISINGLVAGINVNKTYKITPPIVVYRNGLSLEAKKYDHDHSFVMNHFLASANNTNAEAKIAGTKTESNVDKNVLFTATTSSGFCANVKQVIISIKQSNNFFIRIH